MYSAKGVTVGEKNGFEPAMGVEAGVKSVVCRVADESGIVGTHGEKRRVAVNQRAAKALVDAGLAAHAAIGIVGRAKGVMRLRDIMREDGRVEPSLVPFP